jgi:prepilin-type N-terminal cleavage/methylation domain-containing protein
MHSTVPDVRDEAGFTLIELLVVMIITGLLVAVAISGFLGRRIVANDASAKQMANTAEQAAVVYSLNGNGYIGITPSALKGIEASINVLANGQTVLAAASPTLTGYTLAVVSSAGNTFNITSTNGVLTRTCIVAVGNGNSLTNTGGGCKNGTW